MPACARDGARWCNSPRRDLIPAVLGWSGFIFGMGDRAESYVHSNATRWPVNLWGGHRSLYSLSKANTRGAIDFYKWDDTYHALANIPPTRPQLGLQNPCGGGCDECS
eukprot:2764484-Pyramimonas_sp.AAC.1